LCTISFFLSLPPHPTSPLFPYTTLFRSARHRAHGGVDLRHRAHPRGDRVSAHAVQTVAVGQPAFTSSHNRSRSARPARPRSSQRDRKSTRLNSSHRTISYAVFCLKKKKQ